MLASLAVQSETSFMFTTILTVAALIFFVLAAFGCPNAPRFNLIAAGLACLTAIKVLALK